MDDTDLDFFTKLISEICTYAVQNGYEPDDTLRAVSENILALLEIATYNGWKGVDT